LPAFSSLLFTMCFSKLFYIQEKLILLLLVVLAPNR
jgi:hypothetical protein